MRVAVVKEIQPGEHRVALTPDVAGRLIKKGVEVWIEAGAGDRACFSDEAYRSAGAEIIEDSQTLWRDGQVILKVSPLGDRSDGSSEFDGLSANTTLISFLNPLADVVGVDRIAKTGATAFAMELIPRTSRAQSADALSSQASIAGYKAVLLAASQLPKYFPMLTTAAGTIPPAKVFVIGAGVAGLQAIATARRLGAVVEAFDIRPETKEQVQSLGGKFVEVELKEDTRAAGGYAKEVSDDSKRRTQEAIAQHVASADVVITTAQVPGKKAPVLVTESMVDAMKPGSVIVDLAANQGGNCEGSAPDQTVERNGISIIGPGNLPASVPLHASQLYAKNLATLLGYLMDESGELSLNFEDDIIDGACLVHQGEIRNGRVKSALEAELAPAQ
ncbi:MAG: Re/Si-specific NAD(P)(+) transhydrogenase subunit alpha [Cyanobacteria bacterium P01_H01_bin.130]